MHGVFIAVSTDMLKCTALQYSSQTCHATSAVVTGIEIVQSSESRHIVAAKLTQVNTKHCTLNLLSLHPTAVSRRSSCGALVIPCTYKHLLVAMLIAVQCFLCSSITIGNADEVPDKVLTLASQAWGSQCDTVKMS